MKRVIIVSVILTVLSMAAPAAAQGPVVPTPPPVMTPVPPVPPQDGDYPANPIAAARSIDAANARADQWQAVANQAVSSAQSAIYYAYGALADAQAGLYQAQAAFQQEQSARIAAQQGQIQQAVVSAQASQISAASAIDLVSRSTSSALTSMQLTSAALRDIAELKASLTLITVQRDSTQSKAAQLDHDRTALASALVMERQRSDLFLKVAISFFLLLLLVIICIAVLLWRVVLALRPAGRRKMIVVDERGQVTAQIEALN
jgi:hypothetical protein